MEFLKRFLMASALFFLVLSSAVVAGDFDWIKDFNIRAEADPSGFRARLAARFKIGDTHINAVLSNVERPADAYIVLRLGEMSAKPTDYVLEKYKAGKAKGWGELAKSLGIKPGSKEFHALKQGNDFYDGNDKSKNKSKSKGKSKSKDRYKKPSGE
jgi:hypothetical protein